MITRIDELNEHVELIRLDLYVECFVLIVWMLEVLSTVGEWSGCDRLEMFSKWDR